MEIKYQIKAEKERRIEMNDTASLAGESFVIGGATIN
jgi:hypothetical protein